MNALLILLFLSLFVLIQFQLLMISNHVSEDSESTQSSLAYHRNAQVLYHQFPGSFPELSCPVHSVKTPNRENESPIITLREFSGSSEGGNEEAHVSSVVTLVYSTK